MGGLPRSVPGAGPGGVHEAGGPVPGCGGQGGHRGGRGRHLPGQ